MRSHILCRALALCTLLLPLVCSGCAEHELSPVSALSLDWEDERYRLTAELVRQDSMDESISPSYLCAAGPTLQSVLYGLENLLPGELFVSHAQVLLVSEAVARKDLAELTDYLCTQGDLRLTLRLAVVREGAADALMQNGDEVFALAELLDRAAEDGTLPDFPLARVVQTLHTDGTALLPALTLDEYGQTAPAGVAVFARAQLSHFIDGTETGGTTDV